MRQNWEFNQKEHSENGGRGDKLSLIWDHPLKGVKKIEQKKENTVVDGLTF